MKSIFLAWTILGTALAPSGADAASFTWAGYSFIQESTPDVLGLLGNSAVLGGATFSAGNATGITRSVGFQAQPGGSAGSGFTGLPGFLPELSLGRQGFAQQGLSQSDGSNCLFACAVNLPDGNDGNTTRHGLDVSWSGGKTLSNGAGNDFVIYESGSNSTSPEGFMVRVHLVGNGYSDWLFKSDAGYQVYTNAPATLEGAFATVFDLSDFGLAADVAIDAIQIANLIAADTLGAGGLVLFDGSGTAPGFGSGALDPDPLYVGVLRDLTNPVPAPHGIGFLGLGLVGLAVLRRRRADRADRHSRRGGGGGTAAARSARCRTCIRTVSRSIGSIDTTHH
ncbi:MAG: hypothetical protein AB7K86_07850 [Rhodospirillales bacterium]